MPIIGYILIIVGVIILILFGNFLSTMMAARSQKILLKENTLEIFCLAGGQVNYYAIRNKESIILIDTGYGRNLKSQFEQLGLQIDQVSDIFLTHIDPDHSGGLRHFPDANVYISPEERQMTDGSTLRFKFLKVYGKLDRPNMIDLTMNSQLTIEGITILPIPAPGHTPGHTAYLVNDSYLFTGDTFRLRKSGKILPFMRMVNMDTETQLKSNEKLKEIIKEKKVKLIGTAHSGYLLRRGRITE
ncbi:MBL fold metallo-hydrolase [Promethearchaeum syntrophicum]|uniref:MBL fold metallo-hydrolase n=1 Tax=Promethearchaeum syntrophicum TaxID=2594042 RepID=A0A5B9D636_9ARCH|nr:MBL fold metallo-hydrolase [Candidatus Prometheoarchaeum syntrophicum]QEE14446.1 hydroxyacylglutathione hydrolase [Candidatus Prometheoarchaeum syntrophicum]